MVSGLPMQKFKHILLSLIMTMPMAASSAGEQPYALDTIKVCNFVLAYNDKGSGGDQDLSLFTPKIPAGYYMLGGYAQGDYHRVNSCIIAAKPAATESGKNSKLMIIPDDWKLIWTDKGSGADKDGSVWHPVTTQSEYYCIGSVGQAGYAKPVISNYRCLHKCLLENVSIPAQLWNDRNTGSKYQVSMYKLENSGLYFAKSGRNRPATLVDIKSTPVCSAALEIKLDKPASNEQWVNPGEVPFKEPDLPKKKNNEWVNPDDL